MVSFILLLALQILPEDIQMLQPAAIQDIPGIECSEETPDQCSLELFKGQAAPFAGQLLTTELALSLNSQIDTAERKHKAEIEKLAKVHELEMDHEKRMAQIERDAAAKREAFLKAEIERVRPKWYEQPVVVILGTVLAVGVAAGTAGAIANAVN